MTLLEASGKHATLTFGANQCQLQLTLAEQAIDRGLAFGRVAFACPRERVS